MYGKYNPPSTMPSGTQPDAEVAAEIVATTDDVNGNYLIGDKLTKVLTYINGVPTITYVKADGAVLQVSEVNLADFVVPTPTGLVTFPEMECFTIASTPSTLEEMLFALGKTMPIGAGYCEVTIPYDLANSVANSVIVSKNDIPSTSVGVPQSESFSLEGAAIGTAKIVGLPAIAGLEVRLVLNFYSVNPN